MPTFAWVASYESLRAKDISDALGNLQPPIDFELLALGVIFETGQANQRLIARHWGRHHVFNEVASTPNANDLASTWKDVGQHQESPDVDRSKFSCPPENPGWGRLPALR